MLCFSFEFEFLKSNSIFHSQENLSVKHIETFLVLSFFLHDFLNWEESLAIQIIQKNSLYL